MRIAIVELEGVAPYSQSKHHTEPRKEKEGDDDYAKRTWRSHLHTDKAGNVFIPPTAFKNCLSEAAKYLGIQIKGKGKSTYTKHFEAGVMVTEPVMLGITANQAEMEALFLPSNGVRGNGKRVMKYYPVINPPWNVTVKFEILDDTITEDVFREHLEQAGKYIGIGRFRPRNNGFYGRFSIKAMAMETL
jgi:hypothetical protein